MSGALLVAEDGGARHLKRGMRMPDIALPTTAGRKISFAGLPGMAIVYCYPWTGRPGLPNPPHWDDIPGAHGSTPEAEGFRDHYAAFQMRDYEVFGVSGQTAADHKAFAARTGLPFLLLSDHDFRFADGLRLPRFETGGVTYLKRITLIVRDGVIYRAIYPVHPPHTHAAELLAGMQSGKT